jgi:predicted esterase
VGRIEEAHITVARTARYYTIGATVDRPRELWFACHGYGQLAAYFVRSFQPLDDGTRIVIAPEALSRFYFGDPRQRLQGVDSFVGATWMTREDREREIDDHVAYLDTLYAHVRGRAGWSAARVTVLGFSQGVATVCRWLARGTAHADRLVLWAGRLPADLFPLPADSPLRSMRIVIVAGRQDEWVTAAVLAEQEAMLRDAGLSYELRQFAGGHAMDEELLGAIAASS